MIIKVDHLGQLIGDSSFKRMIVACTAPSTCKNELSETMLCWMGCTEQQNDFAALHTIRPLVMPRTADGGRKPELPSRRLLVDDVCAEGAEAEIDNT